MAKESFETALEKLEKIVREMEAGEMPLEAALKSFEEGIRMIRFCSGKLEAAGRRVKKKKKKEDSLETKIFQDEQSDEQ